jgi:hypothetical protein
MEGLPGKRQFVKIAIAHYNDQVLALSPELFGIGNGQPFDYVCAVIRILKFIRSGILAGYNFPAFCKNGDLYAISRVSIVWNSSLSGAPTSVVTLLMPKNPPSFCNTLLSRSVLYRFLRCKMQC